MKYSKTENVINGIATILWVFTMYFAIIPLA